MTFRSTYTTHMTMGIPGCDEREYPVEIGYSGTPGQADTWDEPGCAPSVTVEAVRLRIDDTTRDRIDLPWLVDVLNADEDIQASLLEHWEDQDAEARDRRDEDRAERLREEMHQGG
jgi:hypothetical protein